MPATDALTITTTLRHRTTSPRLRATMLGARITTRRARITIHRAHGTTRRRRTMVRTTSPSPRPRATIRRARTITRHPRATIRHVRILVHDAKETRLLPARIRTTKRLDPVRRSSGLRPRGALDLAIAIRLAYRRPGDGGADHGCGRSRAADACAGWRAAGAEPQRR